MLFSSNRCVTTLKLEQKTLWIQNQNNLHYETKLTIIKVIPQPNKRPQRRVCFLRHNYDDLFYQGNMNSCVFLVRLELDCSNFSSVCK